MKVYVISWLYVYGFDLGKTLYMKLTVHLSQCKHSIVLRKFRNLHLV